MNDRQLRFVVNGLGGIVNGIQREDVFDITFASEIITIFCLSSDIDDLKARLARIVGSVEQRWKAYECRTAERTVRHGSAA